MPDEVTPGSLGRLPFGESGIIIDTIHSGANGQIAANIQPWWIVQFNQDGSPWLAGAPASLNFASYPGVSYTFMNNTPGTLSIGAFAADTNPLLLAPSEKCLVVTAGTPSTPVFTKVSSSLDPVTASPDLVKAVITVALPAYAVVAGVLTANANGAIGVVADGFTPAAGELFLLPPGIAAAAKDSGPWLCTSAGAAGGKFQFIRPSWWASGTAIVPQRTIRVQGGSVFLGSDWRVCKLGGAGIIDTDDPQMYVRTFKKIIQLVNGTYTLGAADFLTLLATTTSSVQITRDTPGAATAATVQYASAIAGRTSGYIGTAAVVIQATLAGGGINAADTLTTLLVQVTNF